MILTNSVVIPVPAEITQNLIPQKLQKTGAILQSWARRALNGKPSNGRMIRALAQYLPSLGGDSFQALGGQETLQWAFSQLPDVGYTDPEPDEPDVIKVLGLPYGGPIKGRDSQGQFFSPMTDFMDETGVVPPVMYVHGSQFGNSPEPVGEVTSRWYNELGGWFGVRLDPTNERYAQLKAAYDEGMLFASSGVIPATYTADPTTGHIDTWCVGELSLVDLRDGYTPVNTYAVTKSHIRAAVLMTDYYGDPVLDDTDDVVETSTEDRDEILTRARALVEDLTKLLAIQTRQESQDIMLKGEIMSEEVRCLPCEEAQRIGAEILAELSANQTQRCQRCPDAMKWVRASVATGAISPAEAADYIKAFSESDETFDEAQQFVEKRVAERAKAPATMLKAQSPASTVSAPQYSLLSGGNNPQDDEEYVDPDWVKKQRRYLGMGEN